MLQKKQIIFIFGHFFNTKQKEKLWLLAAQNLKPIENTNSSLHYKNNNKISTTAYDENIVQMQYVCSTEVKNLHHIGWANNTLLKCIS